SVRPSHVLSHHAAQELRATQQPSVCLQIRMETANHPRTQARSHPQGSQPQRSRRREVNDLDAVGLCMAEDLAKSREVPLHFTIERDADADRRQRKVVRQLDAGAVARVDAEIEVRWRMLEHSSKGRGHAVDLSEVVVSEDSDLHAPVLLVSREGFRSERCSCVTTPGHTVVRCHKNTMQRRHHVGTSGVQQHGKKGTVSPMSKEWFAHSDDLAFANGGTQFEASGAEHHNRGTVAEVAELVAL